VQHFYNNKNIHAQSFVPFLPCFGAIVKVAGFSIALVAIPAGFSKAAWFNSYQLPATIPTSVSKAA
jgi:hypothetical protein